MAPPRRSALILGAFGTFGSLITRALARTTDLPLIAAGRRVPAVLEAQREGMHAIAIDGGALNAAHLMELNPAILIDTVGPFQTRDRKLAQLCINLGIHYVDLADGREFVQNVEALDAAAVQRKVLVVSGASTVPALSSAVVEHLAAEFSHVEEIDIGIAPAYSGPRGLATVRSVLGYVGRAIPIWREARMDCARGWGETRRHRYPLPVGQRNLSLIDVPDMNLLPRRYPTLRQLAIRAGHEVPLVHHTLRLLGLLVRVGLIRDLASHAETMRRMAAWFDRFGSDNGAMHIQLRGRGADGSCQTRIWTLIAEHGDGPQIPATAAILLAKKLLNVGGYAPIAKRGAMPAVNLLTLQEFEREWRTLAIRTSVTSHHAP
ncbi:MAG TPA: saccharopine dehydrogenase NADP-binding domain-containing protein [Steroidobacteraceae bacterium]|nr:saccharopine dehydrogenase NADP-binding domain-containing protein [Steroidobacteraceae bacterium]